MIGPAPVCYHCRRLIIDGQSPLHCEAFPDGVPEVIILGGNDHKGPVEGDHGLRFEPIEE